MQVRLPVLSHNFLLYLTGLFLRFSNSSELSCETVQTLMVKDKWQQIYSQ